MRWNGLQDAFKMKNDNVGTQSKIFHLYLNPATKFSILKGTCHTRLRLSIPLHCVVVAIDTVDVAGGLPSAIRSNPNQTQSVMTTICCMRLYLSPSTSSISWVYASSLPVVVPTSITLSTSASSTYTPSLLIYYTFRSVRSRPIYLLVLVLPK